MKRSLLLILLIGCSFFFLFNFSQCTVEHKTANGSSSTKQEQMQKGMHVFGQLDSTGVQDLVKSNIEWITLVPFGDQKDVDSPTMRYIRGDRLEMAHRDSVWKSEIDLAHAAGLKVFLKPHIWIFEPTDGKWRSDIFPTSEENWALWQKDYRGFILMYARIAQRNQVEMLCIGAEFSRLTIEKPLFWKNLIDEVRGVYSGKLTYAANWYEEFEKITFWDKLDYIGIQAYFPLVGNKYPTVQQISKGWEKHYPAMKSVSRKYNRKILFTEMGYKSTADSAVDPWAWIDYSGNANHLISLETQANCYEAFFGTVWKKEWFAGVHIWQWRSDHVNGRGKSDLDFTPRGKPAEVVIEDGFGK